MDFQRELKSLNLSITPVRLAVLEGLMHKPHSEAAQLFEIVQEKIQTTSIQAVYNNLNTLVERGLVREIKPKGMPSIYEIRKGDNQSIDFSVVISIDNIRVRIGYRYGGSRKRKCGG